MTRRVLVSGGSAAFLLAGLIGPRIVLAPEGGAGDGGGDGGGSAAGGGGAAATGADGASGSGGAAGGAGAGAGGGGAGNGDDPPARSLLASGGDPDAGADGDKPAGDAAASEEKEPDAVADDGPKDIDGNPIPESYEFKMPDGFKADQALLDIATPIFRDAKLSPSQAQAVVDLYAEKVKTDAGAWADTIKGWREAAKADKALTDGGSLSKNLATARAGLEAFGDAEALSVLDHYGLGEHPAILRLFLNVGKAVSETRTIGGDAAGSRPTDAEVMYPSMAKKA